jgi:hypothetical protein
VKSPPCPFIQQVRTYGTPFFLSCFLFLLFSPLFLSFLFYSCAHVPSFYPSHYPTSSHLYIRSLSFFIASLFSPLLLSPFFSSPFYLFHHSILYFNQPLSSFPPSFFFNPFPSPLHSPLHSILILVLSSLHYFLHHQGSTCCRCQGMAHGVS